MSYREIRALLKRVAAGGDPERIPEGASLLTSGVIDSLAMVQLVTALESAYGIAILEDELVPEHFDSVRAIAAFVDTKRRGAP